MHDECLLGSFVVFQGWVGGGGGRGTCIPKETYTFVIFQGKKSDPDPHPTLDPGTTLLNPLLLMDWLENLVC